MNEEQKYIDFESYERVAEPHKRERFLAWRTAIGHQDVVRPGMWLSSATGK